MNSFLKLLVPKANIINNYISRTIFASPSLNLKEIRETQNGNTLVIEGVYVKSPNEDTLISAENKEKCTLCNLGLDIKHTDVLIISQFLRTDGCMLPRRITGLCKKQQKRMSYLVKMAQQSGLMPNINPPNSKKDPSKRIGWKRCNKYFDESTIKFKLRY